MSMTNTDNEFEHGYVNFRHYTYSHVTYGFKF